MTKTLEKFNAAVAKLPEEAAEEITQRALADLNDYQAKAAAVEKSRQQVHDGKAVSWDEVKPWLEKLGTDKEPPIPCA